LAKEGTLFLDEVGDMCPKAQVSLLRVLNDRKIQRLGETGKDIYVDVRVIAATNKNLRKEISERNFREDLFYRLNVIPINLPSIRKYSKEKIESIIWKTLAKIARDIQPEDIVKTTSGKDL
jgi:transcriptional regulator with PAS, ATPase and Fis domain